MALLANASPNAAIRQSGYVKPLDEHLSCLCYKLTECRTASTVTQSPRRWRAHSFAIGQEPEVDDSAVACQREVHHLAHRHGVFIPAYDDDAGLDLLRVVSLIEENPEVASLVSSLRSAVMSARYVSVLLSPDHVGGC